MLSADYPIFSIMFVVLYRTQYPQTSSIILLHACKSQPLPIDTSDCSYCLRLHSGIALLDNMRHLFFTGL